MRLNPISAPLHTVHGRESRLLITRHFTLSQTVSENDTLSIHPFFSTYVSYPPINTRWDSFLLQKLHNISPYMSTKWGYSAIKLFSGCNHVHTREMWSNLQRVKDLQYWHTMTKYCSQWSITYILIAQTFDYEMWFLCYSIMLQMFRSLSVESLNKRHAYCLFQEHIQSQYLTWRINL